MLSNHALALRTSSLLFHGTSITITLLPTHSSSLINTCHTTSNYFPALSRSPQNPGCFTPLYKLIQSDYLSTPLILLRMIVSTERRFRSLHYRIVVRATTDTTDQRRQLIQFYSLTKHNLQTTHNPAGATARTAIRLTRATQSPLCTPAGNRLQTSSVRVQDFLLNISYSRVNTHSHTVFRLPRQPSTACLLDRVLHHCVSHTGFPPDCPIVATQLPTHCFIPTINKLKLTASRL